MANRYVLIEEEFQNRLLQEIAEIKALIQPSIQSSVKIDLLDSADVISYLKISRRTLYAYRDSGLPFTKVCGKLYFRRSDIDSFISKSR